MNKDQLRDEVLKVIQTYGKTAAIKYYRDIMYSEANIRITLGDAAQYVDSLANNSYVTPHIETAKPAVFTDYSANDINAQVIALVQHGRKLDAVKLYRETVASSLKEAKDYIDNLEQALYTNSPLPSASAASTVQATPVVSATRSASSPQPAIRATPQPTMPYRKKQYQSDKNKSDVFWVAAIGALIVILLMMVLF